MTFYNAVFYEEGHGYYKIVCRGYSKREHEPFCGYPTVEEAVEQYSSNADFIGIEWI
jgi:hypothetical protein